MEEVPFRGYRISGLRMLPECLRETDNDLSFSGGAEVLAGHFLRLGMVSRPQFGAPS